MATKQHTYGSGEVSFAQFLANTQTPGARRYIGNTTEFNLTSEQENLDHMDSDHGVKRKDDSVLISLDQSGTIVCDNIDYDNLAIFFLGTTTTLTNASATGSIDTIAAIGFGTYQLGVTTALPTGVRKVASVVVTDGEVVPVTYVAGVDYVVDGDRGTVTFLEGGTIEAGDPAKITYNVAAATRQQVVAGQKTIEGALHFKAYNPVGPKNDVFMPWVKLTPNGDFPLKSDDWLQIPLNVEVLVKGDLAPVYIDGQAVTA